MTVTIINMMVVKVRWVSDSLSMLTSFNRIVTLLRHNVGSCH